MTDADTPDCEAEWQDLTEKEILLGILTELQQIRLLLQGTEPAQDDAQEVFECAKCGKQVSEEDRQQHAQSAHNAPVSMVDGLFERVE